MRDSRRVQAAVRLDRLVYSHLEETLEFSEGELFQALFDIEEEDDTLAMRARIHLPLGVVLYQSPFPRTRALARARWGSAIDALRQTVQY